MLQTVKDVLLVLLGPAGILLGWWLQRRDKVDDRAERHAEHVRAKAEEIYQQIDDLTFENLQATVRAASLLRPLQSVDRQQPARTSVARLRGLVAMYFPNALALFVAHDAVMAERDGWLRGQLQGASDAIVLADRLQRVGFAYATMRQEDLHKLLTGLRSFMDKQVRDLVHDDRRAATLGLCARDPEPAWRPSGSACG